MNNQTISPRFISLFDYDCRRHVATLRTAVCLLLALCAYAPASAQSRKPAAAGQSQTERAAVVAAATDKGARFTATSGDVAEMRLEVFSIAGEKVFDSDFRQGSLLDWPVGHGPGEPGALPDDEYLCVVTVRDLSGRLRQRRGITSLKSGQVTLSEPAAVTSKLSPAQVEALAASRRSQLIEDDGEDEALTILSGEVSSALTATAHEGKAGQVTSTTGALTFRTGDLFRGNDIERLRITPEGNVGIGTNKPQVKLDVAGVIRAREGLMFSDGSTLKVNESGGLTRTGADGSALKVDESGVFTRASIGSPKSIASTQNRIAKFTDNLGTLGDSGITETAGGNVGIGNTNPQSLLQVGPHPGYGATTGLLITNNLTGTQYDRGFQLAPRQTASPLTNSILIYALPTVNSGVTVPTQYGFFVDGRQGPGTITSYGALATGLTASLGATNNTHLLMGAAAIPAGNFAIYDNTNYTSYLRGNVGIGTSTPAHKLDVVGNINASGSVSGATASIAGNMTALTAAITGNLTVDTSTLHVDAANNRLGVGTTTPTAPLDVVGEVNSSSHYSLNGARVLSNPGAENLFAGVGAGTVNTGSSNAFFGRSAGSANSTGSSNAFFGRSAGAANTTGNENSFFGNLAGQLNTTGSGNSFYGRDAGTQNNGSNNAFFGRNAGLLNTTASNNSFFGETAGAVNTTGASNSFFGKSAGLANTTASNNSFFGESAGAANSTGTSNSFFGKSAGAANTTGTNNAFFGQNAGLANTIGSSNAFFGHNAGIANTGGSNAFFGQNAGAANTLAGNNSFFGTSAGLANTTGAFNSFFGRLAGGANTNGANNSFFGRNAGAANTTAANNSFFGESAGAANTTAANNSFFGQSAGAANTTGAGNSFFGQNAGAGNTTAGDNSFFGVSAGVATTTGGNNSFFGKGAGIANTTGTRNSYFGQNTGAVSLGSTDNSFFGHNAGAANGSSHNSFFGSDAGAANTTGNANAFFGGYAGASNTIGDFNSFFGLNTGYANTIGQHNAFFGTYAGNDNTTGSTNSFFGKDAGDENTEGAGNTFVGYNSGQSNTTESDNTFIGANSNGAAGITNATAIGANASVIQSNSLVLGEGVKVGIGSTQPAEKLHVVGNVFIGGNPGVGSNGLMLKSPNGATCAKLTIDNAGALVTTVIACP